jgi:hypothetical protein
MDRENFERLMNAGAFGTSVPFGPDDEWETIIPFGDGGELPEFHTEVLPHPMSAFVSALAESTQTPPEMAGLLALGILSTCLQSKFTIRVTPDWTEPLCLFLLAVAESGERKSAVLSSLTQPIYNYERQRQEAERSAIAENQAERELLEKQKERAQAAAARGKGDFASLKSAVLRLSTQLANFETMHPFRLLTDDCTQERLIDIMASQKGCITLSSAEGGIFGLVSGRYNQNLNIDVYLKAHAGDPITVDRMGRAGNHILHPRLTMMLTVQPQVLETVMANTAFRGRGLNARFLFALCASKVGHREISPEPIPESLKAEYNAFVLRLLTSEWIGTIDISPEADGVRQHFQSYVETKLGSEWDFMTDWGSKLTGAMVRIAALFHAAEVPGDPTKTPITAGTMARATSIAMTLASHAERVFGLRGTDTAEQAAKFLWAKIEAVDANELTKRDLFRSVKGRFNRPESMNAGLSVLVDHGYIKVVEIQTGGRPTTRIFVNPSAKIAKSAKSDSRM